MKGWDSTNVQKIYLHIPKDIKNIDQNRLLFFNETIQKPKSAKPAKPMQSATGQHIS